MIGSTIKSHYRLDRSIGKGGFGEVFEASDLNSSESVVLKLGQMTSPNPQVDLGLFYNREAITLMELRHDHIVRLLDFGEDGGMYYMVMEHDHGFSLHQYLTEHEWPTIAETVRLISQVADALRYVHKRGIIHQDIKPSNIILRDGKIDHCKLVDFGCAVLKRLSYQNPAGVVMGSFPYISPEQLGAYTGMINSRSDLYALGVMLYELLSGTRPYGAGTTPMDVQRGSYKKVAIPSILNPLVPAVLDRIAMKLISHNPADRYQTAEGLLDDLAQYEKLSRRTVGSPYFKIGKMDGKHDLAFQTPFVGREAELSQMQRRFHRAMADQGGVVLLAGNTGAGKTRLLDEFGLFARAQGSAWLLGKCSDTSENYPYFPLVQLFQDYMEYLATLPELKVKGHHDLIRECFSTFYDELSDIAPTMIRHLDRNQGGGSTDPAVRLPLFLERIGHFFASVGSGKQSLVLVFEDIHWADPGTYKLLTSLSATLAKQKGVLAIGSYRPEELPDRPLLQIFVRDFETQQSGETFSVSPFTPQKVWALVSSILPEQTEGHLELVQLLSEFCRGNPLFILEMIRELIEEGTVVRQDGVWMIDRERMRQPVVAKSLVEIILARMKNLSDKAKATLKTASCIGRTFSLDLLRKLMPSESDELESALVEAVHARLIVGRSVHENGEYSFTHDKIYETFYQELEQEQRRQLHLRIAENLERNNRHDLNRVIYSLAYHYARAFSYHKAFEYAVAAGKKAQSTLALHQAAEYFDQAIRLLDHIPQDQADSMEPTLREELADACSIIGSYDRAIENYQRVMERTEGPRNLAALERKIGGVYFRRGAMPTAVEHFSSGLRYLRGGIAQTQAGAVASAVFYLFCSLFAMLTPTRLLQIGRRKRLPVVRELVNLNHLTSFMLFWVDCTRSIEMVMKNHYLANILGSSPQLSISYGQLGIVLSMNGLHSLARVCLNKGIKIADRENSALAMGTNLFYQGLVYMWAGRDLDAIETIKKALEIHQRIDAKLEANLDDTTIAQCLEHLGELDQAFELTMKYKEEAEIVQDLRGIADAYYHQAELFFFYGNLEDARQSIEQCFKYTDEQRNPLLTIIARRVQGRIFLKEGKADQAIEALEDSIRLSKGKMFSDEYVLTNYVVLGEAYIHKARNDPALSERQKNAVMKKAWKVLLHCERHSKNFRNFYGATLRLRALYLEQKGKDKAAERYFEKAVDYLREQGLKFELAETMVRFSLFLHTREARRLNELPDEEKAKAKLGEDAKRADALRVQAEELFALCNVRRNLREEKADFFGAAPMTMEEIPTAWQ